MRRTWVAVSVAVCACDSQDASDQRHARRLCGLPPEAAVERGFKLGSALDGATLLRCETAGDDVLHARSTRPCEGTARMRDLVLCAVDGQGRVQVTVRSAS